MTLVAFHTASSHAELITDTMSYTPNGSRLSAVDKVLPIAHLQAAAAYRGIGAMAALWPGILAALKPATFDQLLAQTPQLLRDAWPSMSDDAPGLAGGGELYQLGYSHQRGRFVAFGFRSRDDFAPHDLTGRLVVMPEPLSSSDTPATPEQWAELAKRVRSDYAHAPFAAKVLIGGDVMYTRLEQGTVTQRRLHTFETEGPEFTQMLAGTLHPLGQLGDCDCGSGQMFVLCCVEPDDGPCSCDSQRRFGDCCKVGPDKILAARAVRRAAAAAMAAGR